MLNGKRKSQDEVLKVEQKGREQEAEMPQTGKELTQRKYEKEVNNGKKGDQENHEEEGKVINRTTPRWRVIRPGVYRTTMNYSNHNKSKKSCQGGKINGPGNS